MKINTFLILQLQWEFWQVFFFFFSDFVVCVASIAISVPNEHRKV